MKELRDPCNAKPRRDHRHYQTAALTQARCADERNAPHPPQNSRPDTSLTSMIVPAYCGRRSQ